MNRRRTAKPTLGFGTVVLLIAAAVVIASAGVFHAYVKNRQVHILRDIQRVEELIAQHELDIKTTQMRLAEEQNRFLVRDRLKEISSDLRPIALNEVREVHARPSERTPVSPLSSALAERASPVAQPAESGPAPSRSQGGEYAVAGVP